MAIDLASAPVEKLIVPHMTFLNLLRVVLGHEPIEWGVPGSGFDRGGHHKKQLPQIVERPGFEYDVDGGRRA